MSMNTSDTFATRDDIQDWLISAVARSLKIDQDEIDPAVAFDRYGMDSVVAVELTGELEKRLGLSLPPTLMYDYPTIVALSEYMADQLALPRTGALAEAV
jgi:acyl carrier protein